ncbi:hypothetical protein HK405_013784 [Cladochytrium tenue]|nr:hypothetical protein HK405_013784 [Cladochytrium tenue]
MAVAFLANALVEGIPAALELAGAVARTGAGVMFPDFPSASSSSARSSAAAAAAAVVAEPDAVEQWRALAIEYFGLVALALGAVPYGLAWALDRAERRRRSTPGPASQQEDLAGSSSAVTTSLALGGLTYHVLCLSCIVHDYLAYLADPSRIGVTVAIIGASSLAPPSALHGSGVTGIVIHSVMLLLFGRILLPKNRNKQ